MAWHGEDLMLIFHSFTSGVPWSFTPTATAELCRYFQIRKAWDLRQYRCVTDGDLIFRNQAKPRFVGERFEHLYRGWKAGRVTVADIRQEVGGSSHAIIARFKTELFRRFGAPEGEPEGAG